MAEYSRGDTLTFLAQVAGLPLTPPNFATVGDIDFANLFLRRPDGALVLSPTVIDGERAEVRQAAILALRTAFNILEADPSQKKHPRYPGAVDLTVETVNATLKRVFSATEALPTRPVPTNGRERLMALLDSSSSKETLNALCRKAIHWGQTKRLSQRAIGRIAGLSQSTVSHFLRGKGELARTSSVTCLRALYAFAREENCIEEFLTAIFSETK